MENKGLKEVLEYAENHPEECTIERNVYREVWVKDENNDLKKEYRLCDSVTTFKSIPWRVDVADGGETITFTPILK